MDDESLGLLDQLNPKKINIEMHPPQGSVDQPRAMIAQPAQQNPTAPPMAPPKPQEDPQAIGSTPPSIAAPSTGNALAPVKPAMPAAAPSVQHENELNRMIATGSGRSQIHNPFLKTVATIGDIGLSAFAPNIARMVPGTEMHHSMLVNNQRGVVNSDLAQGKEQADTAHTQAETKKIDNPPPTHPDNPEAAAYEVLTDPNSTPEQKKQAQESLETVKGAAKQDKTAPIQHIPTDDGYMKVNQDGTLTPLTYNGQIVKPPSKQDKPDTATQEEQQYRALLKKKGLGQKLTPEEEQDIRSYEKSKTLAPTASANIRLEGVQSGQDITKKKEVLALFKPAHDADVRLKTMQQNYEDGLKGDQQAMVSLLTNHLGMTMGLQKGARITQAVLDEAQKSAPWLQNIKAKFGTDGYLQGVTLPSEVMKQMVALGKNRRDTEWQDAHSNAQYFGYNPDEFPKSILDGKDNDAIPKAGTEKKLEDGRVLVSDGIGWKVKK